MHHARTQRACVGAAVEAHARESLRRGAPVRRCRHCRTEVDQQRLHLLQLLGQPLRRRRRLPVLLLLPLRRRWHCRKQQQLPRDAHLSVEAVAGPQRVEDQVALGSTRAIEQAARTLVAGARINSDLALRRWCLRLRWRRAARRRHTPPAATSGSAAAGGQPQPQPGGSGDGYRCQRQVVGPLRARHTAHNRARCRHHPVPAGSLALAGLRPGPGPCLPAAGCAGGPLCCRWRPAALGLLAAGPCWAHAGHCWAPVQQQQPGPYREIRSFFRSVRAKFPYFSQKHRGNPVSQSRPPTTPASCIAALANRHISKYFEPHPLYERVERARIQEARPPPAVPFGRPAGGRCHSATLQTPQLRQHHRAPANTTAHRRPGSWHLRQREGDGAAQYGEGPQLRVAESPSHVLLLLTAAAAALASGADAVTLRLPEWRL
jgi:hypothetical protein